MRFDERILNNDITPLNLQPQTLENGLVRLTPLDENDFDRLFLVASDPLIWEQHPTKDRYKKEVFKVYFESAVASGSAFLIFDKQTDKLIGCTRYYDYKHDVSVVAIGYTFLAKEYWGGVFNMSVKKLLIDYAFQFIDTVLFHIGATNIRSQKAIAKIGAVKIKEVDVDYYGTKLLHYEYEIKKGEWRY